MAEIRVCSALEESRRRAAVRGWEAVAEKLHMFLPLIQSCLPCLGVWEPEKRDKLQSQLRATSNIDTVDIHLGDVPHLIQTSAPR